jgi:hypothetical protein
MFINSWVLSDGDTILWFDYISKAVVVTGLLTLLLSHFCIFGTLAHDALDVNPYKAFKKTLSLNV